MDVVRNNTLLDKTYTQAPGKRLAPKLHNLLNVKTDGVKTLKIVNSATLLGLEIDMLLLICMSK